VNELNTELAAEGKFAINNNAGNGIDTATVVMLERFGPTEKCIYRQKQFVSRGVAVQAHAGSKYSGTPMTCDDGDTNSLAVFLLVCLLSTIYDTSYRYANYLLSTILLTQANYLIYYLLYFLGKLTIYYLLYFLGKLTISDIYIYTS
jgi:hypothetical protein